MRPSHSAVNVMVPKEQTSGLASYPIWRMREGNDGALREGESSRTVADRVESSANAVNRVRSIHEAGPHCG